MAGSRYFFIVEGAKEGERYGIRFGQGLADGPQRQAQVVLPSFQLHHVVPVREPKTEVLLQELLEPQG